MRSIAHISDLHFGTEDGPIADGLRTDLQQLQPSLVIVSGDLTQRARRRQFQSAQSYLRGLPSPQLIVPGNHDVPLYDVLRRFLSPLTRYGKYVNPELDPVYRDEEMLVLGINTARSFTWKNGRIAFEQMAAMKEKLCAVDSPCFKIVVTHHPFIPPPGEADAGIALVGRAAHALEVIDECDVDLLLAGHLHQGYTGDVRTYYPAIKRSVIVAQAGTAISKRIRGTPNAYNFITLDGEQISISVRTWDGSQFASSAVISYQLRDSEWRPQEPAKTWRSSSE